MRKLTFFIHPSSLLFLITESDQNIARVRKAFPEIILRSVPAFSLTFYRLHKHTLYINMKRKPNSLYPLLDYESDLEIHFQLSFDYR